MANHSKLVSTLDALTETLRALANELDESGTEEERVATDTSARGVYVLPGDILVKSDKRNERFVVVTTGTYVQGNTQYGKERANDLPPTPHIPMFNVNAGKFRWTRQIDRYLKVESDGSKSPVLGFREA